MLPHGAEPLLHSQRVWQFTELLKLVDAANAARLNELDCLPDSCVASADCLEKLRGAFEEKGVFSAHMIDGIIEQLRSFNDRTLRHDIEHDPKRTSQLVNEYFQCG